MSVRRPLYGGDRGIKKRSDNIRKSLRVFAKSDFKHDFGENVDTRDKYTAEDLQRYVEISERYGLSKTKALINGFNTVLGSNPYNMLKDTISSQIYPEAVTNPAEFVDEEAVMKSAGIDYHSIKTFIKNDKKARKDDLVRFNEPIRNPNLATMGDDEPRSYSLSAVPMKINGKTANIASSFYSLSNKKTKFAIIIDAAGGLSLTSIKKTLEPVTAEPITFYIIENIENDSDSATKLKNIDKDDKSNVTIRYLKEAQTSVVYPPFELLAAKDQGENLYGNARLTLSRTAGGDTEADFIYSANEEYHIDNVSQNANVKNASLNLLAAKEAGRTREAYLYPYLKRVGDWCQALSLLDTSRVYDVLDENHNPIGQKTSLYELEQDDVEVALVTLDRILLAYALNLGVNVFFTSGSDITSLLYFKNNEVQLSPEKLQQKIQELQAEHARISGEFVKSTITSTLQGIVPMVSTVSDDVQYIRTLRSFLSNVSMMRFDFDSIERILMETEAKIPSTQNPSDLKQVYTDAIAFRKKYQADNVHNNALLESMKNMVYPDFPEESEHYTLLSQERPSRRAISSLKTIISQKLRDDAEQVKAIFARFSIPGFPDLFRPASPTASPSVKDVFTGFKSFTQIIGKQLGGNRNAVLGVFQAIAATEVTPVTSQEYQALLTKTDQELDALDMANAVFVVKEYQYRDDKLHPYTICDRYIVTRNLYDLLASAIVQGSSFMKPDELNYICVRLLILHNDILMGRYEEISNNEEIIDVLNEDGMKIGVEESDVNYTEHKRLHVEAQMFREIIVQLKATGNFMQAIQMLSSLVANRTKWTNDTVNLYMQDARYGVRNNDFGRTLAIIRESQDSLLKGFAQMKPLVLSGGYRKTKTRRRRRSSRA